MAERPGYCIPRRCGLCRFILDDGDTIVVVGRNGMVVSQEHPFRTVMDEDDMFCVKCGDGCPHDGEQAAGCHPGCLALVPSESRSAFIKATSYRYQPPPAEDERRTRWLRLTWSSILRETYRLPPELCYHIAQYCLRPFAVLRAVALWESSRAPSRISFSTKVWARYTLFEGVRYISFLTNKQPTEHDPKVKLVFEPMSGPTDTTIFLGEDHLGVRELLSASSSETPTIKERPNIWWRSVAIPSSDPELESLVDGIKLRTLTREAESPTVLWPLPQRSTKEIRLVGLERRDENPDLIRMSAFKCNDPAIIGYSVCHFHRFLSIHAHIAGEDTKFVYQSKPSIYAVWQYMPVDRDEAVVEIWKHYDHVSRKTSLMFKTDKGRITLMGAWPSSLGSNWTLLDRPSKQPSRIFYDTYSAGIRLLGFAAPPPTPDSQRPELPTPLSTSPSFSQEDYYYTSAALDGITAVTPSLQQIGGTSVITGLLLHRSNEHTSCVGQIRLDSLGCPLEVGTSQRLWLGFLSTTMGGYCMTRAATSRPTDIRALTWLALPFSGLLEWWFSYRQCRIHHEGQASPETCRVPAGQYRRWLEQREHRP
ncbi:uncharacterized protein P884DRAFT_207934 [Thermothelomyces heterothallicus CBS 202.75]|uniref:uncharacterized protein n=1 Tax=Thermothelomyces heterothallicus CBS 202.75 TaxID=1149848 RepID=UPI00374269F6